MSEAAVTTGRPAALPRRVIRKTQPVPYYAQLAELFREAIRSGEWAPGRPLPSEQAIGEFFDISRTAVRQALAELVAEGLVRKEKGRGTFVRGPRPTEFVVQELRGFYEEMSEQGKAVDTEILLLDTAIASAEEAALLRVPTGGKVVQLDRLRRVDGEPICFVRTLLPSPRFAGLTGQELAETSLYEILRNAFGVEPTRGSRTIEATRADRRVAGLLDVRSGSPLLRLTAVNVDQTGEPFEHFTAWYRADRTSFRIDIGPDPSSLKGSS